MQLGKGTDEHFPELMINGGLENKSQRMKDIYSSYVNELSNYQN